MSTRQEQIWQWDAVDIAEGVRSRQISCREAVQSCLSGLDEVNPTVNAVVDVTREEALCAADEADAALARGDAVGPLHGVPVTIKTNVDQAGRATSNGVVAYKDLIALEDSPSVANLRRAGAIIIGRTNTPAFSLRWFTDNALYGATLNPWNKNRTPGGSSGGAASAVAVGICPLAHGNDSAGSVRYPAYACGVAGIRPSFGRVATFNSTDSQERPITAQIIFTQGLLGRRVRDLRVGLRAISAHDPRDSWWVPVPFELSKDGVPRRVAVFADGQNIDADEAVSDSVLRAGDWLIKAGYEIEEIAPPRFCEAADLWIALAMTSNRLTIAPVVEKYGDDAIRCALSAMLECAPKLDLQSFLDAFAHRETILRDWQLFLERYPLVLMPVSWRLPFPLGEDLLGSDAMRGILAAQAPLLAVSMLGLPGLVVPTGIVEDVPVGIQLVAARFHEELCFEAGEVIELNSSIVTPVDPRL